MRYAYLNLAWRDVLFVCTAYLLRALRISNSGRAYDASLARGFHWW